MKLYKKISENVKGYAVLENSFLWNSSFELHKLEKEQDYILLNSKNGLQKIRYEESCFFVNDSYGGSYIGTFESGMEFLENMHIKKNLGSNRLLISYQGGTHIYNLNSNENKRVFDYRIYTFQVIDDFLFYTKGSELNSYDLKKNVKTWSFSLASLGTYFNLINEEKDYEVRKIIGSHKGLLVIQLSNATLLFLDIQTGEKKQVLHLYTLSPLPQNIFYDDDFPPHIINDYLVWLNNQRLLKIDLKSYLIELVRDYFNVPKKEQFRFMHNTYFEGGIYFVADYGWQYVTPSRIGVMNGNTGEVVWQNQLEKTGGLPEPPTVTLDKFYIRTAKGTLYIFDRFNQTT